MGMEQQQVLSIGLRERRRRCGVCGCSGVVMCGPDNQGSEYEDPCPVCNGTGWLPKEDVTLDGPASFVSESNSD